MLIEYVYDLQMALPEKRVASTCTRPTSTHVAGSCGLRLDLHGRTPTEVPGSYDDDVRRAHSKLSSGKKHDEPE